jgi:hypothetical protein
MDMTRFATLIALTLTLSAVEAVAQTTVLAPVPPTTMLAFDHDGLNTDGYALWVDGVRQTVTTTLVGTTERRTAFPAMTPGTHTIEFTAFVMVDGVAIDSAKSPTLTVRIVVVPVAPGLPRLITVSQQANQRGPSAPRAVALVPQGTQPARRTVIQGR